MEAKKPTEKQIGAWFNLTKWALTTKEQIEAGQTIQNCFTRLEMSKELFRIRNLYMSHKLNKNNVFDSPFWNKHKEEQNAK